MEPVEPWTVEPWSYFAIPRTWIIRDGVLVAEMVGFSGDWQKWQDAIVAQLK